MPTCAYKAHKESVGLLKKKMLIVSGNRQKIKQSNWPENAEQLARRTEKKGLGGTAIRKGETSRKQQKEKEKSGGQNKQKRKTQAVQQAEKERQN